MTQFSTISSRDVDVERTALGTLLRNFSTEVTTRDRKSIDAAIDLLPPRTEVFIASLRNDDMGRQVTTAVQMRRAGLTPVPHVVARNLSSSAALKDLLARLTGEAGVDRALILGGDRDKPAGVYDSSLQLIETDLFQEHGVKHVSLACYPEGHPRISGEILGEARAKKLAAAARRNLDVLLVSQFCFEAKPIIELARKLRAEGVAAPLRVGVAGVANKATLMKYALMCGVGASLRALKERQDLAKSLLSNVLPDAVLGEVATARDAEPSLGIEGVHFFTFGSLGSSVRWVKGVAGEPPFKAAPKDSNFEEET